MATPYFSTPIVVVKPAEPGNDSYYDVLFNAVSPLGPTGTVLDGWCIQPFVSLDYNNGYSYSGYGYPAFEVAADNNFTASGAINWLLNYYRSGTSGYTAMDVQNSIWHLVAEDFGDTSGLTQLALSHNDFVPDVGDVMAVVIDPVTAEQRHDQNLIVETKAAKLGDRVWHDADADGIQDAGEAGIAGATVQLVRDANGDGIISGASEILATTSTDANGNYSFKGLTPGLSYQVRFTDPAGYDAASPRQSDGSATSGTNSDGKLSNVIFLAPGEYNATVDSGFYKYATIGDKVWNDTNGNGIQDTGETGKSGVRVELYTCGVNDQPGTLVSTQTTDANGNYSFSGLKPGDYMVKFIATDGTVLSTANVGNDALDSDASGNGFTGCYTLSSGETNTTVDAGFKQPSTASIGDRVWNDTLGDRVWNDTNGNGVQDAGETGKAGVKVELYTCGVGDQPGTLVGTKTTDANGNYSFSGLKPGDYMVKFISTDGTILSTANVGNDTLDSDAGSNGFTGCYTLTEGQTNNTVDAGFTKGGSIGDTVWLDTNRNGYQDETGTGIAGVTVQLKTAGTDGVFGTADDVVVQTKTTDANGKYLFTGLTAGDYQVQFSGIQPGTEFTTRDYGGNGYDTYDSDADQVTGRTDKITLAAGQDRTDVDAGVRDKLSSLGDRVWFDTNRNGVQDAGEAGKAGVLVQLYNVGADGVAGTGDDVYVNQMWTDANGNYKFTDLAAGNYAVRTFNGYGLNSATEEVTIANAGGNDATDSDMTKLDADRVGGYTDVVKLGKGEDNMTLDIGITARLGSIGDKVWVDTNRNGYQDETTGVAGVTVQRKTAGTDGVFGTADDVVVQTKTTDANGNYLFTGLTAGDYQVQFSGIQPGTEFTTRDYGGNGYDTYDSDADQVTGRTDKITLAAGQDRTDVDAGIRDKLSSLATRVWFDTNRNGVQDAGEAGKAGVLVRLFNVGADGVAGTGDDVHLADQWTDANGNYKFTDLAAGNYAVKTYNGYGLNSATEEVTVANAGGNDAADSDMTKLDADRVGGYTDVVKLGKGEDNMTLDIGITARLGSIGDKVWLDTNRNGYQDETGTGIAGVTVQLKTAGTDGVFGTADDVVVQTKTTDANGNYLFTGLTAGDYQVKFSGLQPGTELTTRDYGGNGYDTYDSDADQVTGSTGKITLAAGQDRTDVDAGVRDKLSSLGDRVWFDTNRNGVQDAGEAGKAGVLVQLYNVGADGVAGTGDDVYVNQMWTDANGNYKFTDLAAGNYAVRTYNGYGLNAATEEVTIANAGGNDATDSDMTKLDADRVSGYTDVVKLGKGEDNLTLDIGITARLGSIGDKVWLDTNRNGYQDETTGVAGVTVQLKTAGTDGVFGTADDVVVQTKTTDANGNYLFTGLKAGDYQVQFSGLQPGTELTTKDYGGNGYDTYDSDADQVTGSTGKITLAAGQDRTDVDAGVRDKLSSLGDRVWFDTNRNGVQDAGEAGKAVLVRLFNVGADGVAGTGDDVHLADQWTDANGNYKFTDLAAGNYAVKTYNGYGLNSATEEVTIANAGGNDATDSDMTKLDADRVGGYTDVVKLGKGEDNMTLDIGITARLGSIGDKVWVDTNNDGYQNDGDTGVAGVKVELKTAGFDGVFGTADDVVVQTKITDANGNYLFTGLTAGDYQVRFSGLEPGAAFTTANYGNNGADTADSDANQATGLTDKITLAVAQDRTDVDAGIVKSAALGDRVWYDTNANGQQDAGEAGAAGVRVTLHGGGADKVLGTADDSTATVMTDATGGYHFYGLTPGMPFQVEFQRPDGYMFTRSNIGNDASDSDADLGGATQVVTLAAGERNFTLDAGLLATLGTRPDAVKVCEDRSVTFNVLANDNPGLKLVGVAHESAALDSTFQSKAGAISFAADGTVTYKTMTNYYGNDKLVYTVEDAAGNRSMQTVDVTINPISDALVANGGAGYHPGGWENTYVAGGVTHWVHGYTLADFETYSDTADQLQQFGTYNTGVANDADTLAAVVVSGLKGATAAYADIVYNGQVLDFSQGQTYTISVADINAGKLDLDFHVAYQVYNLAWQMQDTGTVANPYCYDGSILSNTGMTVISTPIALDLNGDGKIGVTGATSSYDKDAHAALGHTVQFDMDGNGTKETTEWFDGSGDGILIDNRDGNAAHDMNGSRLFGDQGGAYGNGYYKLAALDINHDGKLSGGELKGIELWVDNGDAVVQSGEIQTLAQHGIDAIGTEASLTYDAQGKLHIESTATRTDGSTLMTEDVFFAGTTEAAPTLSQLLGHDSLDGVLGTVAPTTAVASNDADATMDVSDAADVLRKLVAAMNSEQSHATAA